jgi:hypothetical protein
MEMGKAGRSRRRERGVSFLLVVVGIFSILGMAMFAIDVVTLYTAKAEAQKAADAAALAGAKMFVLSGSTSGNAAGGTVTPANVCATGTTSTQVANALAAAAAGANTVGGATANITNYTCSTGGNLNPTIQVTVARTDLPLFFARVFGNRLASVSATATAEAFNNTGRTVPIGVGSVKPWAVANCGAVGGLPAGGPCLPVNPAPYFVDTTNGDLLTPSAYVGKRMVFGPGMAAPAGLPPGTLLGNYYPIDFSSAVSPGGAPIRATLCPGPGGLNECAGLDLTSPYYIRDTVCATNNQTNQRLTCGSSFTLLDPATIPTTDTQSAARCLIHYGTAAGQQDTIIPGNPVTINGGSNNPNTALQGVNNISRSDSVVTVPVFTWSGNPCGGGGPCNNVSVIGFLQLGINDGAAAGAAGVLDTVVINAVGCDAGGPATPTLTGGALNPVPVRLVQ